MRMELIALLAVAGLMVTTSAAKAATVTLYLTTVNATLTSGTWQLYIADSLDNDGLANFDVDIVGGGGVVVNSVPTRKAPQPVDSSGQYPGPGAAMGFDVQVNSGSNSGTGRVGTASELRPLRKRPITDLSTIPLTIWESLWASGRKIRVLHLRTAHRDPSMALACPRVSPTPFGHINPFAYLYGGNGLSYPVAGTLIEQGSYTTNGGPSSFLAIQPEAFSSEVLGTGAALQPGDLNYPGFFPGGDNVLWGFGTPYQQGNSPYATATGDTISLVPEPASFGLLILVGVELLSSGRKIRPLVPPF